MQSMRCEHTGALEDAYEANARPSPHKMGRQSDLAAIARHLSPPKNATDLLSRLSDALIRHDP